MVLARKFILVLILITALGGSAAYFVTAMNLAGTDEQARQLGWLVFALMSILSIALVVLIWRGVTRTFTTIIRQLRQFEAENKIGMIMVDARHEWAELAEGINHYLTHIKSRLDNSHVQRKGLEIQAALAEIERTQTEAVIFSISEAVLVTDQFDELLLANRAAEELFGFELEQARRRPLDKSYTMTNCASWSAVPGPANIVV